MSDSESQRKASPTIVGSTIPVGSAGALPDAMAFDGQNVWVADLGNKVTRIRVLDGANLGSFNTGSFPAAMAFDGANVWVVNNLGNSVNKM